MALGAIISGSCYSYAQDIFNAPDSEANKTGIYDARNLLKNPGFETVGKDFGNNQYAPADWSIEGVSFDANQGVRAGANQAWGATQGNKEGKAALLWRDDSNGSAGAYLYQEVSGLKANTTYKVAFLTMAHDQNRTNAIYYVKVGSTKNGDEYFSQQFNSLANGEKANVTGTFTTPASVGSAAYFTIANQETYPEKYNEKWSIIHLDRMSLYEADGATSIESNKADKVNIYSENGMIIVEGTQDYSIITIWGHPVAKNKKLNSGLYIVTANGQSYKVIVK